MDDARIEAVARQICANLGLDPDERVGGDASADYTPGEHAARADTFVPDVYVYYPRWRLYRGKAAEAIATQGALTPEPPPQ